MFRFLLHFKVYSTTQCIANFIMFKAWQLTSITTMMAYIEDNIYFVWKNIEQKCFRLKSTIYALIICSCYRKHTKESLGQGADVIAAHQMAYCEPRSSCCLPVTLTHEFISATERQHVECGSRTFSNASIYNSVSFYWWPTGYFIVSDKSKQRNLWSLVKTFVNTSLSPR